MNFRCLHHFGADGVLSTPLPSESGTCNITPSPHLILGTPTLVVATPSVVRLLGVATILSHTNPQKLGARDGTRTRKAYASAWKAELLPLETLSQNCFGLARMTGTDPALSCVTGKRINLLPPPAPNLSVKLEPGRGIEPLFSFESALQVRRYSIKRTWHIRVESAEA